MSRDMRMTTSAPTSSDRLCGVDGPGPPGLLGLPDDLGEAAAKVTASLREASDELLTFYRFPPASGMGCGPPIRLNACTANSADA